MARPGPEQGIEYVDIESFILIGGFPLIRRLVPEFHPSYYQNDRTDHGMISDVW